MQLDREMRRVVSEQGLGFVATVCPDGSANVSPKGTLIVWDEEHLAFIDLRSPGTVRNLAGNPSVEVNVVDPIVRKGYRFKGTGRVLSDGEDFERIVELFVGERGMARERARAVVLIHVDDAAPLISPSYDLGASEEDVIARWRQHHLGLHAPDPPP